MYQVEVPHKEDSLGGSPPDRMKPRSVKTIPNLVALGIVKCEVTQRELVTGCGRAQFLQ